MWNDTELWAEMTEEVTEHVKHYFSDFYNHDRQFLDTYTGAQFIWSAGDCGTHIGRLPDQGMAKAIAMSYGHYRHFIADRKTGHLKQISRDELLTYAAKDN